MDYRSQNSVWFWRISCLWLKPTIWPPQRLGLGVPAAVCQLAFKWFVILRVVTFSLPIFCCSSSQPGSSFVPSFFPNCLHDDNGLRLRQGFSQLPTSFVTTSSWTEVSPAGTLSWNRQWNPMSTLVDSVGVTLTGKYVTWNNSCSPCRRISSLTIFTCDMSIFNVSATSLIQMTLSAPKASIPCALLHDWSKETLRGETPVPMIGAWGPTDIHRVVRRTRDSRSCSTYTTENAFSCCTCYYVFPCSTYKYVSDLAFSTHQFGFGCRQPSSVITLRYWT